MMVEQRKKSDILRSAKALIQEPAHWCKDAYALTLSGLAVSHDAPAAYSWCALGAVMRVYGPLEEEAAGLFGKPAAYVACANDYGEHADIMAMFDRAIALAEAAEAGQ